MLRLKDELVFPLVKVEKYKNNGSTDSLVAFAPLAVTMLRGWQDREAVDPSQFDEKETLLRNLIEEYVNNPSEEALKNLSMVQGGLNKAKINWFLSQQTFGADIFTRFFSLEDEGRGHNAYRPSLVAAEWMWMALKAGAVQNDLSLIHI